MSVAENLAQVKQELIIAAQKCKRDIREIKLVAVSKTVSVEKMKEAVTTGMKVFGENRVQELVSKIPQFSQDIEWHLIGNLQTNKVKYIIDNVNLIHSLDKITLAREISKRAEQSNRIVDLLVEVNIGGEETKNGINAIEAQDFIEEVSGYSNLRIIGLMTVAPYTPNPEEVRPVFRGLKKLSEQIKEIKIPGVQMETLSMGMSNDFAVAVEEGATIVRVGSKIFGDRIY